MRRLLRLAGHGVGVLGAALGIETLAMAAIPGLARFLPLGLRLLRTDGLLGTGLLLLGALLVAAASS